ncbi:MAG: patatin-like phospholipase family protein [Treponemataceae bacterium]
MKNYIYSLVLAFLIFSCKSVDPAIIDNNFGHTFTTFAESEKYALVLGGGGAKGAYEMGVFRALKDVNYPIHLVTGTSVGSLNSIFVVMDDLDAGIKLWNTVDETMIFSNPDNVGLSKNLEVDSDDMKTMVKSLVNKKTTAVQPLKDLIASVYDPQKFYESKIDFATVTFDISKQKKKVVFKNEIHPEDIPEYMIASASSYPVFEPHIIGDTVYIDGAYMDNLPIGVAKEMGATKYVVVNLKGLGQVTKESQQILESEDVVYIESYWNLGSMFYFNPENARRNMQLGYFDTLKALGAYKGRAYTFFSNAFDDLEKYNLRFQEVSLHPSCYGLLDKHWQGRYYFSQLVMSAAEICAEMFDLSPLILYKEDFFNAILKTAINETKENLHLLSKTDSKAIALSIASKPEIFDFVKGAKHKKFSFELEQKIRFQTREFLAALYIFLIMQDDLMDKSPISDSISNG